MFDGVLEDLDLHCLKQQLFAASGGSAVDDRHADFPLNHEMGGADVTELVEQTVQRCAVLPGFPLGNRPSEFFQVNVILPEYRGLGVAA